MVVQTPINNKDRVKELEFYLNIAAENNVDFAIFPEGYLNIIKDPDLLDKSLEVIKKEGINTLFGVISPNTNSAYFVDQEGKIGEQYLKRCLFGKEKERFERGKSPVIFNIRDYKISPLICYDLFFPEISRELMGLGVDVIPVLGIIRKERRGLWYSLLETRANENNIPFLASCGVSEENKIMKSSAIAKPRESVIKIKGDYALSRIEPEKYALFKQEESPLERGKVLFDRNLAGPYLGDLKI